MKFPHADNYLQPQLQFNSKPFVVYEHKVLHFCFINSVNLID